jgi:hypothetical protein
VIWFCVSQHIHSSMQRAVTRLLQNKQLISVTMITHATEEPVTFTMTSHNRRATGNGDLYAFRATAA